MTMFCSRINFLMISKALFLTMEALQNEQQPSILAIKKIKKAQDELQQALSFAIAVK